MKIDEHVPAFLLCRKILYLFKYLRPFDNTERNGPTSDERAAERSRIYSFTFLACSHTLQQFTRHRIGYPQ